MEKESKFMEFQLGMYPRIMWVGLETTWEILQEEFVPMVKSKSGSILNGTTYGTCIPAYHKDNFNVGIVVLFKSKTEMTPPHMAHEAVHIADFVYKDLEVETPEYGRDESYAYLVEYILRCMGKFKSTKNHKKFDK